MSTRMRKNLKLASLYVRGKEGMRSSQVGKSHMQNAFSNAWKEDSMVPRRALARTPVRSVARPSLRGVSINRTADRAAKHGRNACGPVSKAWE